jgi:DUF4097 and DUF4098 domain-containing protein YvlB
MALAPSASLPTLLLGACATVTLTGCGLAAAIDGDTTRRTEDQTVPADGIRVVDVETDNGAIEIRGGDGGDEITIHSVMREQDDGDADTSIQVDGDRLVVTGECDRRWWNECSIAFVVTMPSETDVRVETDNGRVAASGLDGDVAIETDNGAIEATALGGAAVVTETDNGRIHLTFSEAPMSVRAHTDNGSISVRLPDDGGRYAVDADSDNGDVDIDVGTDPEAERTVVARSDNGAIDVEYDMN